MKTEETKKSEQLLNAFDASIKRLITPTTFLVAAAVISRGLDNPDSNPLVIYTLVSCLFLFSIGYFIFSVGIIAEIIEQVVKHKVGVVIGGTIYIIMYFVVFVVAIMLGLSKVAPSVAA